MLPPGPSDRRRATRTSPSRRGLLLGRFTPACEVSTRLESPARGFERTLALHQSGARPSRSRAQSLTDFHRSLAQVCKSGSIRVDSSTGPGIGRATCRSCAAPRAGAGRGRRAGRPTSASRRSRSSTERARADPTLFGLVAGTGADAGTRPVDAGTLGSRFPGSVALVACGKRASSRVSATRPRPGSRDGSRLLPRRARAVDDRADFKRRRCRGSRCRCVVAVGVEEPMTTRPIRRASRTALTRAPGRRRPSRRACRASRGSRQGCACLAALTAHLESIFFENCEELPSSFHLSSSRALKRPRHREVVSVTRSALGLGCRSSGGVWIRP